MIHISLSPNTESDDVRLATSLLFSAKNWDKVGATEELCQIFKQTVRQQYVFFTASGRSALLAILRALGIGRGDEVILQAYTCVAVPDPILWAGAKPVYVDCTSDFLIDVQDIERKITDKTKAIIVQHTFGAIADMEPIITLAQSKNIIVIEDCAHALGSTRDGAPAGTRGDVSFYSFGRDKMISSVFGGAVATNNPEIAQKIETILKDFSSPPASWVRAQLRHPVILTLAKKTYHWLGLGKIILEIAKRLNLISKAVYPTELRGGKPEFAEWLLSPALAQIALLQLKKLDRFTAQRQKIAEAYSQKITSMTQLSLPTLRVGESLLRYSICTPLAGAIRKEARKRGMQLGDWYTTPLAPPGADYAALGYILGSCPNAERLAAETCNLPTHIGITADMIDRIVAVVNDVHASRHI